MSVPLPYGPHQAGVERPAPVRAPRPYLDRLKQAPDLVAKTKAPPHSIRTSFPLSASILMVLGAFAPIAFAPLIFREAFFGDLAYATYPLSAGLTLAADLVLMGWLGAALLCIVAAAGLAGGRALLDGPQGRSSRLGKGALVVVVLVVAVACAAVWVFFLVGALSSAAGAMWILLTGAVGLYGARMAARRDHWQGAVAGAVALFIGGRFVLGGIALSMLVLSDREFPGQTVALYPWRRSQVSVDPIEPAPAVESMPIDDEELRRLRPGLRAASVYHALPFLTGLLTVVGAALPLAYSPWWRGPLFEPLVAALGPFGGFVTVTADVFWGTAWGLVWVGATTVGAVYCSRFAFARTRRGGAAAGGVLLVLGGRPIIGTAVVLMVLASTALYGRQKAEHKETPEPAAAAH